MVARRSHEPNACNLNRVPFAKIILADVNLKLILVHVPFGRRGSFLHHLRGSFFVYADKDGPEAGDHQHPPLSSFHSPLKPVSCWWCHYRPPSSCSGPSALSTARPLCQCATNTKSATARCNAFPKSWGVQTETMHLEVCERERRACPCRAS